MTDLHIPKAALRVTCNVFPELFDQTDEIEDAARAISAPVVAAELRAQANVLAELAKEPLGKDMVSAFELVVRGHRARAAELDAS